jgi:CBS domain-containing protein
MKALHAMTRNVVCISEDESLEVARDIMREWEIRHLPVMRDKQLVGILSDRDLLLYTETEGIDGAHLMTDRQVREAMTVKPITCGPTDSISHIAGLMIENKIDCVPITEANESGLVGLVTSTDLLDLLRERDILDVSRSVPWSYAVRMFGGNAPGYV